MNILIVEDDLKIATLLSKNLAEDGFLVDLSSDGIEAWEKVNNNTYDAIILDIMIPRLDGLELLKRMRAKQIIWPVLILSAKRTVQDKIVGLQEGGDDYLEKPFAYAELLARLNGIVRRYAPKVDLTQLTFDEISLNTEKREVYRAGKKIFLQAREFLLLEYFMRNPEVVLTKALILKKIWNYNFNPQTNVVDVLVYRLRNKINQDFEKKYISTERGQGYVLRKN